MICNASDTRCCNAGHSFFSRISLVNNCDPNPTHVAPALNHDDKLASVGSTPPVIIRLSPGTTGVMADTKPGPSTDPGNILMMSAPFSFAVTISVNVAHPGIQCLLYSWQTLPMSGFKIGAMIKSAPASRNFFVVAASM